MAKKGKLYYSSIFEGLSYLYKPSPKIVQIFTSIYWIVLIFKNWRAYFEIWKKHMMSSFDKILIYYFDIFFCRYLCTKIFVWSSSSIPKTKVESPAETTSARKRKLCARPTSGQFPATKCSFEFATTFTATASGGWKPTRMVNSRRLGTFTYHQRCAGKFTRAIFRKF